MTVRDLTTDKSFSKSAVCKPVMISILSNKPIMSSCIPSEVEWIVERPGYSPLADFGTVKLYDNTATNYKDQVKPINYYGVASNNNNVVLLALNMVGQAIKLDEIQNLNSDGSFSVTWDAAGNLGE
jgi:hypothetical protein